MQFLYLRDIFLTPIFVLFLLAIVWRLRRRMSDPEKAIYFVPAFAYKVLGAIALGLIYQFYYGGGDTYYYYMDGVVMASQSIETALMIIFRPMDYTEKHFALTYALVYFGDGPSFMISRISGFFSLLSGQTYTINAICFAMYSFAGSWQLFRVLSDRYPHLKRSMALATLFLPSTFFWGSGLLKDSITFGALGFVFYHLYFGLMRGRRPLVHLCWFLVHAWLIWSIKSYIIQMFIPAFGLWLYVQFQQKIPVAATRFLLGLFQLLVFVGLAYLAVRSVGDELTQRLDEIGKKAKVTSEWIQYMSSEGTAYYIGELDGTFTGMLGYFPRAVVVAFFRPGLWEVRNPLMLLAALENTVLLWLVLRLLLRTPPFRWPGIFRRDPYLLFALVYALLFGFLVGITSGNFGTLARYKIPMLPFFASFLLILSAPKATKPSSTPGGQTSARAPARGYVRLRDR